jgi:hypothetical protein
MIRSSSRGFATDPNEIFNNPKFAKLIERAKGDIQKYWYDNVKRYFSQADTARSEQARLMLSYKISRHKDQIRSACKVSFINGQFVVIFKSMTSEDGRDYGDFLVYGTGPSPGVFVPQVGARVRNPKTSELEGFSRGISTESWIRWKADLSRYIDSRMERLMDEIYQESSVEDILGG